MTTQRRRWLAGGLAIALWILPGMRAGYAGSGAISHLSLTEGDRLFRLGLEQYQANDLEAAMASWQQALQIYDETSYGPGVQLTLTSLGAAAIALGHYGEAIPWLEAALEMGDSNHQGLEAEILGNLAIALQRTGHYGRAIAINQQALQIMRALGNGAGEEQILSNLGNSYEHIGDYDSAIAAYHQSLALARRLGNRQAEGITSANLGNVYAALGQYERAILQYRNSLSIATDLQDPVGEAHATLNLGSAYARLSQDERAQVYYERSLSLAQEQGDRRLESLALSGMGMILATQGDYETAIAYQERSVAIAQSFSDRRHLATMLNNLGHTLQDAGQLAAAELHLRHAIDQLDDLRHLNQDNELQAISIFDTQVLSYNLLQQVLVAQGNIEAALEFSEQGRSRALAATLSDRQRAPSAGSHRPFSMDEIRHVARTYNATLVEYSIIPDDSVRFQGKQRGREQTLLIWVVKPSGEVILEQVDLRPLWSDRTPTLTDLVAFTRERIGVRSGDPNAPNAPAVPARRIAAQLHQLHTLLIDPIAEHLPSDPRDRVVIIPHESLFLVPFAALQDANGRYLLERHTLLSAPSIHVLALADPPHPTHPADLDPESVLVVGNPTMPVVRSPQAAPYQLSPLPGSEQEAQHIASLFNTQPLLGDAATATTVLERLPQAKLIHLATHGLLSYVEYDLAAGNTRGISGPLSAALISPGAIALAPSEHHDGLLTAEAIRRQSLSAELVVLSACNTGRGQITGDGVVGLSRSFLAAGATRLVVTLWAVPDEPTAALMAAFYQYLQAGQDHPTALRLAMLETLDTYNHPLDWAAFTLIGVP
jgi:CHAT domain-containing protein/tetratricopeptide (TPR) repeat protein